MFEPESERVLYQPVDPDIPGEQPPWTEKVEDREKWNGVVFRWVLYVQSKVRQTPLLHIDLLIFRPHASYSHEEHKPVVLIDKNHPALSVEEIKARQFFFPKK